MTKILEINTLTTYSKNNLSFDTTLLINGNSRQVRRMIEKNKQLISNTVCEFYIKSELESWIKAGNSLYCKLKFKITGKGLALISINYQSDSAEAIQ